MSDSHPGTELPGLVEQHGVPRAVHDDRDINAQVILWLGGGLFAFVLVVIVVAGGLFRFLNTRLSNQDTTALPMASEDAALPVEERVAKVPAPRLEGIEPASLAQRRAADAQRLKRFGWVDEKQKIVYVPIEVAMRVLVEKKLLPVAAKDKGAVGEKR
jgi:hypothetical protein